MCLCFWNLYICLHERKAKIPAGYYKPISTNAYSHNKAIASTEDDRNNITAADHEWKCANIALLFFIRGSIPAEKCSYFYSGSEDDKGIIRGTLCDTTFEGSYIFHHCAQLIAAEEEMIPHLQVALLHIDDWTDHNPKFLRSQLASK